MFGVSNKRTIVVYNPLRYSNEAWLPVLWAQSKTFYERNGSKVDQWHWAPCNADLYGEDLESVKLTLGHLEPDVFAVSMYVWNHYIGHQVAEWVKQQWPKCLIITGGPHQYFKYNDDWFTKHPYIDASLPGESPGELCLQQILDNLDNNGHIDWDCVSDVCYPKTKSRYPTYSKKVTNKGAKKQFDYDWSAFDAQLIGLQNFVNTAKTLNPRTKLLSIFETTRGCPYGCTYCDWGGGINTSVLKKSFESVKKDLAAICQLNLNYFYFADANFGIFGDRDVAILSELVIQRKKNVQIFQVGYGGFAKTENKLPYIEKILKIDLANELSLLGEIKISMQSLDEEVLKNIDRKNVSLEKQLAMIQKLSTWRKKVPIYVEFIAGLPGITLDKFYRQLDVLGENRLSLTMYPWILLPEAPAYNRDYRNKFKIDTVVKTVDWRDTVATKTINEIVVESYSYTKLDYLEMTLAYSLYKLIQQGGWLKSTVMWLEQNRSLKLGNIIQLIQTEFLKDTKFHHQVVDAWSNDILPNHDTACRITVNGSSVFLENYYVVIAFLHHDEFTVSIAKLLQQQFQIPDKIIQDDLKLAVHEKNFGTKQGFFSKINYAKQFYNLSNPLEIITVMTTNFNDTGSILRAKKTYFV
jgi:putative methyltransferase